MDNRINYKKLAESLKGVFTVETLCSKLNINRSKAIHLVYNLRKMGIVRTRYGANKKRIYFISLDNKYKRKDITEKINEVSPIQLASSTPYYIHGREPSYEEALIYALKRNDVRYTIASLALFRKIKYWNLLYQMAKKEKLLRKIVSLYFIARTYVKKVRKMPKRFINLTKKEKTISPYIVDTYYSKDFKQIEKQWSVYIPFNKQDMQDYKT